MSITRRGFFGFVAGAIVGTAISTNLAPTAIQIPEPVLVEVGPAPVGPLAPQILDMVRVFYPNMIANLVAEVQPMETPASRILTIRPRYTYRPPTLWQRFMASLRKPNRKAEQKKVEELYARQAKLIQRIVQEKRAGSSHLSHKESYDDILRSLDTVRGSASPGTAIRRAVRNV